MGEASNDSVIYFYGSVTADSKNTLKIVYGPRLMPSSNTLIAQIYVEGTIYPTVDANGNFTYPEYLEKDLHYQFQGGFDDNGDVNITLGFVALGGGYRNTIHGKRL